MLNEKFNTYIKKLINKDTNFQNPITVKKGDYSVKLNEDAQDLIKKLIKNGEKFYANIFKGEYLDCGTLKGYINSVIQISKENK